MNASYKLEYNKDNAGWQLITVKPFIGLYKQLSAFIYDFIPSLPGVYQFRVTDILDPLNTDVSADITVNVDASGALMEYAWDYSGNRPNIKPIGVATDGTARLYVKISKKAGNNKTISSVNIVLRDSSNLSITQPALIGKIMKAIDTSIYSIEANAATSTTVSSSTSGSGNAFWFWYVAPDDFVRNNNDTLASSRFINLVGTVTYSDNSTDPVAEKVEIVRPPLMFVHGIGGDETTWDDFSYSANGVNKYFTKSYLSQWKFKRANNMFAGGSYIQNAQILLSLGGTGIFRASQDNTESYDPNSFRYSLKQMRDQHYASNKVDYIAHSMGGDMARTAINLYASQYIPAVVFTSKFKNYGKGFINKLITLNTPHNGSPIADLTIDKLSQNFIVKKLLQGVYTFANGDKLVGSFFNTTPFTGKLDFNSPTEALKNLRYGPNGVKFLASNVKNHLISGDLLTGGEDCLDAYDLIKNDDDLSFIVKLSAALFATDCIAIDQLYTNYGVNDFFENSDFVVPLSSQLPNKNLLSSGSDYSIFYGSGRNHLSIHNSNKNPDVGQKVFDLLNASISSTSFSNTIAANTSAGSIIYTPTSINTYSEWIDTSKIIITSPVRQSNSSVDSTINISVRLKDTLNFKSLNVFFQSNIYSSASKATNQIFNVQVNPSYVDSQSIVATANYDSLGNDVYYTDTLSINILIDPIINDFYVTPKSKYLDSGQVFIPIYNLIHSTYISNVSIFDPALNISVADTNVVTYSNVQKNFIAKDTGTTFAVVSYKNFKDTIFFIISTTDKEINNICPGSTITFNSVATGTSYQWQVDVGSGYTNISDNTFYSGANTTALTLVNASSAWYGYKYRCITTSSAGSYYGSDNILKFSSIWIGATDTTWENPQNWSCGTLPDGNTDTIISGGFANYPIVNSNASCRSLSVNPGAMIKVKTGHSLSITGK